jgi:DNA-binding transcriptional ArsR family regulator
MIPGPLIAEIAAVVGEPARAIMLSALLDGRPLTASELAFAARVTPQTASTHLAKLTEAGLLVPIREGRHRYFRLASPKVVEMLDGIMAVALENRPRYRPLSRQARELSAARICYDHLAGRLSVDLAASLITREYIAVGDEAADITPAGTRFLAEFGIDLSALSSTRRPFCRLCLDWTERRPHIAGALGAALTKRCFDLGWTERMKHSSAVIVTASGKHGFRKTFGIRMLEETPRPRRSVVRLGIHHSSWLDTPDPAEAFETVRAYPALGTCPRRGRADRKARATGRPRTISRLCRYGVRGH